MARDTLHSRCGNAHFPHFSDALVAQVMEPEPVNGFVAPRGATAGPAPDFVARSAASLPARFAAALSRTQPRVR